VRRYSGLPVVVFLFVSLIDQVSKELVRFYEVDYWHNQGVSFGVFAGEQIINYLVFSLFIFLAVVWIRAMFSPNDLYTMLFLSMVVGVGFSNLLDRFLKNGVVDFIYLGLGPRFNFADVFISLGVALVIYFTMMRKNETV